MVHSAHDLALYGALVQTAAADLQTLPTATVNKYILATVSEGFSKFHLGISKIFYIQTINNL